MKHIGNISPAKGSVHKPKRVGRGPGSGHGKTSTRGHKGHKARSGFKNKNAFEGGQMPLSRRLPKFGFTNPFRIEYQEVNVGHIQKLMDSGKIDATLPITMEILHSSGAVSSKSRPVKILGNGVISATVTVHADKFTSGAKEKIESLGGAIIVNE